MEKFLSKGVDVSLHITPDSEKNKKDGKTKNRGLYSAASIIGQELMDFSSL